MKITLKTLQGKQLPMEIQADMTVEALKNAIAEQHAMPAESQNLVAYGKVLAEAGKTVTEYNIKDGDFIVVMVKKAKPAPKAKAPEPVPEPKAEEPKAEDQPMADASAGAGANAGAAGVQPANPEPQPVQPAQPTGPPVDPEQVETLVAISGKDKELCTKALQAAFGDPDRAFQYLTDGIPQGHLQPGAGQPGAGQPGAGAYGGEGEDEGSYGGELPEGVDANGMQQMLAMAANPNFPQLRARILQNPAFYQEFMSMLERTQPQMHQAINQNPQAFMQLILGGQVPGAGAAGAGAGAAGQGGAPGQGQQPPGTISVTQPEMEAITRLEALGFSRNRCVQAYFACDKNEEFAANFLFEQAAEDDDDALNQGVAQSSAPVVQNPPAEANPVNPNPAPVENKPAEEQPAEPKPEEGAGASEAQQNPQPGADNNNGGNGDNEPDAGAGAGGDAPEKSAFE